LEAKKVLIVSTDQVWLRELSAKLKENPSVKGDFFSYPPDAKNAMKQELYDCFIIEDSVSKRDVESIFEYIAQTEVYKKIPIILTTKDFSTFQSIIDQHPAVNIRVLDMPAPVEEVAKSIFDLVHPKSKKVEEGDGKTRYPVDLDFLKTAIENIQKTILEMTGIPEVSFGKPFMLKNPSEYGEIGVSARVVVSSKIFTGSFYLLFPSATYLKLYSAVVGEVANKLDDGNKDLAGEIVNIVYGKMKKRLNDNGYELNMAIPQLVLGFDKRVVTYVAVATPFFTTYGQLFAQFVPNLK